MTVLNHLIHHRALARLAARAGVRVAGWDAIVLTAGSEEQAALYQRQLAGLCERGLVAPGVVLLAVPDRGAARIGSGGATFEALRVLAERQVDGWGADGWRDKRVLLVHAGGHAKRTPWANVLGKPFVPLPLHADPDRDCPLLIDHIVASAAPLARDLAAAGDGGVVVLTGDVLALWDGDLGWRPGREAVVLSKAVPLDAAGRHGVVVGDDDGWAVDLLQKPTPEELIAAGGLVDGGAALLDTGLFAFRGAAWAALWQLATAAEDPVAELVAIGAECSLYEDLAGALVPARHAWVRHRPLGERLVAAFGDCRLALHRCDALGFVHLGTTAEYLAHLARSWDGQLQRRLLVGGCEGVDDRAVVLVSRLRPGASVGPESVVVGSRLGARARIGGRRGGR